MNYSFKKHNELVKKDDRKMHKLNDDELNEVSGGARKSTTLERDSRYCIHWQRDGKEGTFNGKVVSTIVLGGFCVYQFTKIEYLTGDQPTNQYSATEIITATKL